MSEDPIEQGERLRVDQEIYQVLGQARFQGRLWRQYAGELAGYGCRVLEAWLATGLMADKVKKEGHGGVSIPP